MLIMTSTQAMTAETVVGFTNYFFLIFFFRYTIGHYFGGGKLWIGLHRAYKCIVPNTFYVSLQIISTSLTSYSSHICKKQVDSYRVSAGQLYTDATYQNLTSGLYDVIFTSQHRPLCWLYGRAYWENLLVVHTYASVR